MTVLLQRDVENGKVQQKHLKVIKQKGLFNITTTWMSSTTIGHVAQRQFNIYPLSIQRTTFN